MSRSRRRLLLSVLFVLAVPEIGTRLWLRYFASEDSFRRYASVADLESAEEQGMFTLHRYLGMIPTPGYEKGANRHNRHGLRGAEIEDPKPAGEFRIACVGASMSYTSLVKDWRDSYPAVLERELHALGHTQVRTLNAGCNNWSTYESLINFQFRLAPLEPDLVIVYHAPNDLKARFVWPPEQFQSDNSGYNRPSATYAMVPLHEHSAFLRVLSVRFGFSTAHADLSRTLAPVSPHSKWGQFNMQMRTGRYPSGFFAKVPAERVLEKNTTVWFERNLRELIGSAERAGAEVVLASFAPCSPKAYAKGEVAQRALTRAYAQMNDSLRSVAESTSAAFYDFAAEMPGDPVYFGDDVHVNVEGAKLKGRLFAEYLHGSGLLP